MASAAPALRRSLAAATATTAALVAHAAATTPASEISDSTDDVHSSQIEREVGSHRKVSVAPPPLQQVRDLALRQLLPGPAPCRCDAAAFRSDPVSSAVAISVRDSRPSTGAGAALKSGKEPSGLPATQSGRCQLQRFRTIRLLDSTAARSSLTERYEIDPKPLGEGAYGEVMMATDRRTGEELALKKIFKDRTNRVEFQREMDALMRLRWHGGHPNICMLRENFDEPDHFVLIFDLIRGGELFEHLIENGAYSEADAARLVRDVASALDFCHAIGIVHGDLKPENLLLSSREGSAAAIKLVDFGCAEVLLEYNPAELRRMKHDEVALHLAQPRKMSPGHVGGSTPAYCPPEAFDDEGVLVSPSLDMWSLGIIIYMMLTGVHPFDLEGTATEEEVEENIRTMRFPPLQGSPYTAHLSPSALDLLSKLLALDPNKRLSAHEMLQHPWVLGRTASRSVMHGSDKRLSRFRRFQGEIETKVFEDLIEWSDDDGRRDLDKRGKSLLERAFGKLDKDGKGFLSLEGLAQGDADEEEEGTSDSDEGMGGGTNGESDPSLCLSDFSDLVGENMKQKFFPRDHVIYREGDLGDRMYFVNSGTLHVSTADGFTAQLGHGDTFGVGGLLETDKRRSATIACATPVHAIEIDEECFRRYLACSNSELALRLKEKVIAHKFGRAEYVMARQEGLFDFQLKEGDIVFDHGEDADAMYVLEDGQVDVFARGGNKVYSLKAGELFGFLSFIMDRPRKTMAACVSSGGCKLKRMEADDFRKVMESSPKLREALREQGLRREFQRAVVRKTKRSFPKISEMKEVFDAIDTEQAGQLNEEGLKELFSHLDKSLTEAEIKELIRSMDLNETGTVCFEEFKKIFGRI